ncbi:MAG: TonB family protein [Ichthyobacteriaceae bacterium]|nr:TonB family protein [Ichthyobacteriaceae bacterium]
MEAKKSPKADLEHKKSIFMQIGLILSLLAVYLVLEAKSYDHTVKDLGETEVILEDEEVIQITERTKPKPPPPPPPPPIEQIIVAADDVELEEELVIESTETDDEEEVEVIEEMEEEEEEEVFNFQVVESKPIYPGCEKKKTKQEQSTCFSRSIMKHVKKNFKYPEIAKEMGVQGRVIVSFVIWKDGSIKDVKVLRGVDKNLDKEAVRIVSKIPSMKPAQQRGKSVPVSFMLPITFRLQ